MPKHGIIDRIVDWFPANSVLYRIISSSFLGDEIRQLQRLYKGEEIIMFEDKEQNIKTGFIPSMRLKTLDLEDPTVREGLRISLKLFSQMNDLSKKRNVDFLVILIPTKESVFSEFIEHHSELPSSIMIDKLISNEREVNQLVKGYFKDHSIEFIDVLDPLRNAAGSIQLYPNNFRSYK